MRVTLVFVLLALLGVCLQLGRHSHYAAVAPLCALAGMDCPDIRVEGMVAPGYERLRDLFETAMRSGVAHGATLAAYVRGRKVADLTAGFGHFGRGFEPRPYGACPLQNIFSSGKALEPVALSMLVDRGHLDYNDRIAKHWPEFAANNKENITVAEMLRHEGGLAWFHGQEPASLEDVASGRITQKLAQAPHLHPGENRRIYHSFMRGMVLDELVRRVHPRNLTLGQMLEQDVAAPLGLTEQHFKASGLPLNHSYDNVAATYPLTLHRVLLRLLLGPLGLAKGPGQRSRDLFFASHTRGHPIHNCIYHSLKLGPIFPHYSEYTANAPIYRASGLTSAAIHSCAEGVARILGMVANHGVLDGVRLLNASTIDRALANAKTMQDDALMLQTTFNDGGWHVYDERFITHNCGLGGSGAMRNSECQPKLHQQLPIYGWTGAGGSHAMFSAHPKQQWSYSFVMNTQHTITAFGEPSGEILSFLTRKAAEEAEEAERAAREEQLHEDEVEEDDFESEQPPAAAPCREGDDDVSLRAFANFSDDEWDALVADDDAYAHTAPVRAAAALADVASP